MKIRIDVVGRGAVVSIRIDGAGEDETRRLLGVGDAARRYAKRDGRRRGSASATPEMVARGVDSFLAQGDRGRLGEALAEVWRAMEEVRSGLGDVDGDD